MDILSGLLIALLLITVANVLAQRQQEKAITLFEWALFFVNIPSHFARCFAPVFSTTVCRSLHRYKFTSFRSCFVGDGPVGSGDELPALAPSVWPTGYPLIPPHLYTRWPSF